MNTLVLLAILLCLLFLKAGLTRWVTLDRWAWMAIWWVAFYAGLKFGVAPPLPSSIVALFMAIVTLALMAYLSSDAHELAVAKRAMVRFLVERRFMAALLAVCIALPLVAALWVYSAMTQPPQPPTSSRTIHPPPPWSVTFQGKSIDLVRAGNPFRELETTDPSAFAAHSANGRRVYFENCFYCHGDNMQGQGMFAHGFDPIPANFNDPTTIAMLQESYLFWRIATGAPGLPSESTPWSSAMPAWENFLTEEEIWDVIIFLYDFTGYEPRAQVLAH